MSPAPAEHGPGLRRLIDWLDGRLPSEEAAELERRVDDGDEHVLALVTWLRDFKSLSRASAVHDVPPIVRQRLSAHFDRWSEPDVGTAASGVTSTRLIFDSRWDLAAVGVRGVPVDHDMWHLAYSTDAADIVLDVYQLPDDRVRIEGQVFLSDHSEQATAFEAEAVGEGVRERTVDGDALGRFRLPSVPDRAEQLRLSNGHVVLTASLHLDGRP